MVFSESYISDTEAESRLSYESSSSSARAKPTTSSTSNDAIETIVELLTPNVEAGGSSYDEPNSNLFQTPDSYELMVLDSSPYLCSVPQVHIEPKNKTSAADSKAEEEKELARAVDRGWELLKDLEGECMYFISGWWSYSFCYNTEVKQFHQLPAGRSGVPVFPPIEDQQVPSYVLGKFQSSNVPHSQAEQQRIGGRTEETQRPSDVARLQTKGDMRYLVQNLSGGTTCDLTGKHRRIEVQFHCNPQSADRIGWIKEVSTCSYLMVIYTPRLCNDVAFQPPQETKAHQIICREIISEGELEEWQAKKASEHDRDLVDAGKSESKTTYPIVGDIEVGAMKVVGKDGRRIEPPKPVIPVDGKADIVAKADPNEKGGRVQKLSNEDLKKLNLDPETVDQVRKKLEELAGDKGWSLKVVDGPEGFRELIGILDGEDDDDGGGAGAPTQGEEGGGEESEGTEELYKDEL